MTGYTTQLYPRPRFRRARFTRGAACLVLVLAAGCSDLPTASLPDKEAYLLVRANVAGSGTHTLAVEVTAPDILTPLVYNLTIADGVASGTLTLPAGDDRTITGRAYNVNGAETHRGSKTLDVEPGDNPAAEITLLPLDGNQPITLTLGSYSVSVNPETATMSIGATLALSATVTDSDGAVADVQVQWSTLAPDIATVDALGKVTAHAAGQATIVAAYAGVGAAAAITIEAP